MKQILCMKWGKYYGPKYVNTLYSMIERNITGPFTLYCLTDDPSGVRKEVTCFECPTVKAPDEHKNGGWRKIALWATDLYGIEGEVLFLDLDIVITGNLNPFFEYPGDVCIIKNWTQPKLNVGNTSVFRFTVGKHSEVLDAFNQNAAHIIATYDNEQMYVTDKLGKVTFWPEEWCKSFKVHCIPKWPLRLFMEPKIPEGCKIIAFTGTPNPHEAAYGHWPLKPGRPKYKKIYQNVRPTPWIKEYWQ